MTQNNDTKPVRAPLATFRTALALSTFVALAALTMPALADEHHDRRGERRDHWNGLYYNAPPVVYGSRYYYPPPVVYGPGIGIVLPGISIGVR
jgi:hypothetical protein